MSERHNQRCEYCGRFMPWARWSSWNCFAGFPKAWCDEPACVRKADSDQGVRR